MLAPPEAGSLAARWDPRESVACMQPRVIPKAFSLFSNLVCLCSGAATLAFSCCSRVWRCSGAQRLTAPTKPPPARAAGLSVRTAGECWETTHQPAPPAFPDHRPPPPGAPSVGVTTPHTGPSASSMPMAATSLAQSSSRPVCRHTLSRRATGWSYSWWVAGWKGRGRGAAERGLTGRGGWAGVGWVGGWVDGSHAACRSSWCLVASLPIE